MNAPLSQVLPMTAPRRVRDGSVAPPLEKLRLQVHALQILADLVLIIAAHALAAMIWSGDPLHVGTLLAAKTMVPLFLTVAFYNGTYSLDSLSNWRRSSLRMAIALMLSVALFNFITFYIQPDVEFSRPALATGFFFSLFVLSAARYGMNRWVRRRFGPTLRNVLVIEDGGSALRLQHAYHVSAQDHGLTPSLCDPHALDRLGSYVRNMDRVVIACAPEKRLEWALALKGSGVHGEVISDFARELGALGVHHYDKEGYSALVVSTGPLGMRARITKRLFDTVFAGAALLALSPLFLVVAALIAMEDGGPILFRQRRLGRGNRFFTMYKFRSMKVERCDADGNRSASRDDDRITRIGRILRSTSIDELPQLLNVLGGQMSIVGPRPHAIGSQAGEKLFWEVDRRYWQRHSLKPGLTGLAQIKGFRGATHAELDLQLRLQADLDYLSGWSIWRDIHIILMTLRVVVHDRAF